MKIIAQYRWKIYSDERKLFVLLHIERKPQKFNANKDTNLRWCKIIRQASLPREKLFMKRSMQRVECNLQIRHIAKEWSHLTWKTHCKNKELIYCISGRNASAKKPITVILLPLIMLFHYFFTLYLSLVYTVNYFYLFPVITQHAT